MLKYFKIFKSHVIRIIYILILTFFYLENLNAASTSKQIAPSDFEMMQEITFNLNSNFILKQYQIKVNVIAGIAQLSGQVTTEQQFSDAIMLTKRVKGILEVDSSQLRVQGLTPELKVALLAKVRANIIQAGFFSTTHYIAWPIKINIEDQTIYVTGQLNDEYKKNRILTLIKRTDGVQNVIEDIQIVN